jgi:hypothetical protein
MSGFETVSVFAEIYGRRTRSHGDPGSLALENVACLYIQNSVSGDYWEDLHMNETAEPCIDGPSEVVFSYTAGKLIKGPWFRWKVAGNGGGTGIGEITFRVVINGGSRCA